MVGNIITMKRNPILENMKEKVRIIDGSLSMLNKMQNGETIKIKNYPFNTESEFGISEENRIHIPAKIEKLINEQNDLIRRIRYIEPGF